MKKYIIAGILVIAIGLIGYYQLDNVLEKEQLMPESRVKKVHHEIDTTVLKIVDTLVVKVQDTLKQRKVVNAFLTLEEEEKKEYTINYVVVIDQDSSYHRLKEQLIQIKHDHAIEVDSMGRYYNEQKKRIVLPDDDQDELYAGAYFPRRFPSVFLSLEYLESYREVDEENTIALIAGIFETEAKADSLLNVIERTAPDSYILKSKIYTGCMH